MTYDDEADQAEKEYGPAFFLAVIFIVLILITICVWAVMLLSRMMGPRQTPTPELPLVVPTTNIPTAMPIKYYSIYSPIILTGSANQQTWVVIRVKNLGYEMDGQRYDLATFKRINSQDTAKAYCINRGWDVPAVGTEYMLSTEGIFIPVSESYADPLQRFLRIK